MRFDIPLAFIAEPATQISMSGAWEESTLQGICWGAGTCFQTGISCVRNDVEQTKSMLSKQAPTRDGIKGLERSPKWPVCLLTNRIASRAGRALYNRSESILVLATSTAVERVFSAGRQLLHFTRNRLNADSVRRFLCLGTWCRANVIGDDIIEAAVRKNMGK
jgi:hypothetical protein